MIPCARFGKGEGAGDHIDPGQVLRAHDHRHQGQAGDRAGALLEAYEGLFVIGAGLVEDASLFRIAQDFEGALDLVEHLRVATLVGMVALGRLAVGGADLLG